MLISGHPKNDAGGSIAGPFGTLGADMTTEQGYAEAREVAITVLANIKAEIGELSRIGQWIRVFGMVTSTPGYTEQHLVVNGFSDLIVEVFGPDVGKHAQSAIGVAHYPWALQLKLRAKCS